MNRELEITKFQEYEARYYKIHGAHQRIDLILNLAHMDGRELTENEMSLVKENGSLILEELYEYDALEITDKITVVKEGVDEIKKIATGSHVFSLEETLSTFVTE
ncbi:hypothetical protein A2400_02680 [candidate division WS6 bacterium RIFOXYB1_FULL_33_14]|uniref:Uncharacterized protein n=1 Tax=candidate division WS6 bacterium RIFOXYB1_FULL_33_14 TaxID=1817896 RepID=A0A1F4UFR1_9BACT|nr:MAG: hypothetical protein A2400_02680 [candidate division WS6 bacterium RIFOXYB1_FULL_33_14]